MAAEGFSLRPCSVAGTLCADFNGYPMTALAINSFNAGFELDLDVGRKVLDKTAKLTERVSTAVVDALKQESIKVQVDHQFDVVIGSINTQLSCIEQEVAGLCENLKYADQVLISQINDPTFKREHVGDSMDVVSDMVLFVLHLTERSLENAIQRLDQSGINRACVGECIEKLSAVNLRVYELSALIEQIAEHFRISNALLEKPLTRSSNQIFNRLLEKHRG